MNPDNNKKYFVSSNLKVFWVMRGFIYKLIYITTLRNNKFKFNSTVSKTGAT